MQCKILLLFIYNYDQLINSTTFTDLKLKDDCVSHSQRNEIHAYK
jgi:hypothetical protein